MIIGNPNIAISAADCCALAAIAAKNVNTKLRLPPPSKVMQIKVNILLTGFPSSKVNNDSEMMLIINIRNRLNISLAIIKSLAPAME